MPTFLDPHRNRPGTWSCYSPSDENAWTCANLTEHPGWRHAESFDQIKEWLDNDMSVADRDGDVVVGVEVTPGAAKNIQLDGGSWYLYRAESILIEDLEPPAPPATQEDEDEALASILQSFKATRLDRS